MMASVTLSDGSASGRRRRGRRPAGEDTRTALLGAARSVFAESGYESATVRAIAARAGVDAAMVNHWFGGKEGLFGQAVLHLPFDFRKVVTTVTAAGTDRLGESIVRTFLTLWDGTDGETFAAIIRSVTSREDALRVLRETLINRMFADVVRTTGSDQPELRASLCATQVIGLGMTRYVAVIEPLASAGVETLVAAVAPTLQRYLTGDLGNAS
jgi:AcrR family transcriptional regulator